MQKSKVLLIGNGPSAMSLKVGKQIDNFDGLVVRFNAYNIKGFEEYVGTRTDVWITCSSHPQWWKDYKQVWFVNYARHRDDSVLNYLREHKYPNCDNIPEWAWQYTYDVLGEINWPCSSGAVATSYFIKDYDVQFYGFDFFSASKHHYGDNHSACYHKADYERRFFGKLIRLGKITPFNDYLRKFNYKIFDEGVEQEVDKYRWIYEGGCPGYGTRNHGYHTYSLIEKVKPKTLLDVGCGKGQFVEWCKKQGIVATGVDFASDYGTKADVTKLPYDDNSFDVVTSFDLFEHLKDVNKGISEAIRVSKDYLIVSVGYGKSNIKTPDGFINLHNIYDKDEKWWFDKLSEFGNTTMWGSDFYNHPFFVVRKER